MLDAALVRDLLAGVEQRGLVDNCKILISGYLGSPENAAAVSKFVAKAKAKNPKLLYLCDPVMGDAGTGFYVGEELRTCFAKNLVPVADILTPNQFELESLVGRKPATLEEIASAAARGFGPSTVAVTGVRVEETPPDVVQTLAVEPAAAWAIATPKLACSPSGTGDLFAALFAAALVQGLATMAALEQAVSGVYAVLEETINRGSYEMALVPAVARLLRPRRRFTALPISPRTGSRGAGKALSRFSWTHCSIGPESALFNRDSRASRIPKQDVDGRER